MSLLFRSALIRSVLLLCAACTILSAHAERTVRVCADPDNFPFSSQQRSGFDNRIAELLIHDLHAKPVFVWARARRGFLRERFNKGECDVLMGVPEGMRRLRETKPYYRSSYVFVTRRQEHLRITSFSDPAIGRQRIGLQILEEDFSPPSLPLIRYGHAAQLVGFESFGSRAGDIVKAVADKRIGMAVVWGPLAGYYAAPLHEQLVLEPVSPQVEAGIPFAYNMTIATHPHNEALAKELNAAIERNQAKIAAILRSYHVVFKQPHQEGL
ncbi:MAG: quinoprotein dehydrogenase-associated putative ABC transporter substrate-binding protein [Acidobacteria bacterium]|nr:quinoprotein dehydrogenase-associated putative ABC transporter substrate-binding protein [Acidobacteriota bacterium]